MTDLEKLKKTITVGNLVAAAGSTYFQRGEGYADDGLVRNLHFEEDQLRALVDGTSLYETFLFEMDGELEGECSCPLGRRDEFCKHLAATGLAWLALQETGAGTSAGKIDQSDGDVLEGWLKKLKKAELVELIQNQCLEDLNFFDRMLVRAAASGASGDLSGSLSFHQLVNRCEEMNQLDRAVEWLEIGMRHYQEDNGLEEKCVELYWKQKRYDEALAICWKLFERSQTLDTYKRLVIRAKQRKELEEWRAKALDSIRANIAVRKKEKQSRYWYSADHSLLVKIFLWKGDHEQAWLEAQSGDCSSELWLKLCRKREQEHPDEIFPIYLKLARKEVEYRNNDAYHSAVRKIEEAKKLANRCDQSEQFNAKLESIRTTHKPKRNFMKYLAESGL